MQFKKTQTKALRIVEVACWLWRHNEFLRIYMMVLIEGMDRVGDDCVQNVPEYLAESGIKNHETPTLLSKRAVERMKPGFCVYLSQL